MCDEKADNFLAYAFFFIFLKSISKIQEKERKLGPMALLQ